MDFFSNSESPCCLDPPPPHPSPPRFGPTQNMAREDMLFAEFQDSESPMQVSPSSVSFQLEYGSGGDVL